MATLLRKKTGTQSQTQILPARQFLASHSTSKIAATAEKQISPNKLAKREPSEVKLKVKKDVTDSRFKSTVVQSLSHMCSKQTLTEKSEFVKNEMTKSFPTFQWHCDLHVQEGPISRIY